MKCHKLVSDSTGYHFSVCSKPAKFERNGKWYCGIHDPQRGPTKTQIAAAEKRERVIAGYEARALAMEIANACASGKTPKESMIKAYRERMRAAGMAW